MTKKELVDLSNREKQVLDLVIANKTSQEIGNILQISHRTVEVHRANIRLKLGVQNGKDAVRKAAVRYKLTNK